jgi:predicted ATPase/DNA-binding CsgD family transcriptional regulator
MTPETLLTTTNLPAEPNAFIGRERDTADLRRLFAHARAVTLCGPGGIGKTRLALRVARSLLAESDGGVWLVELADVTACGRVADPVTCRLAAVFGVRAEPGRSLLDTLADVLGGCDTVIVLDNCEHLIDSCARLCRELLARCPRLRVLATSREPLRIPGENTWRVPPLMVPQPGVGVDPLVHEAVRLFVARATAVRPDFALTPQNAPAVVELCRALDGVPLALELAAARMRLLSVEQLALRVSDRFRLLSAGDRTAPPRQRTLRAAIDWSHELLTEPERVLLRRLSVFAGWSLERAEQVCADELLPEEAVLDLLSALVDKSLVLVDQDVVAGESRFRMLDSIRQYAAERLAAAGENEVMRDRHRDALLEHAEYDAELGMAERKATWDERVRLFARYDAEQHNLRAALSWSLERHDVGKGLRLCLALRPYWGARGYFAEAADWHDRFVEASGDADLPMLGGALVSSAQLALAQRDYARAVEHACRGVRLCRDSGDRVMMAAGLSALADVLLLQGRYAEAVAKADEALAVARAGGDQWNEAIALYARGSALARQGRLREAQSLLESGAQLMRDLDHRWGLARGLALLAWVARARGDLAVARRCFEEALPGLRKIDSRPEIARALGGIGRIAIEQGDLAGARQALGESLRLASSIGMRIAIARGLEAFVELLAAEGDFRGAVVLGGAAAALRDAIGQVPVTGARLESVLEPIRRRLGEPLVAQLWGEGRATTPDTAVVYALRGPMVRRPRPPAGPSGLSGAPDLPGASGSAGAAGVCGPPAPASPPSTLTARERELARMIARGLSNRAIAAELVISPATVARHVSNILGKLGFSSRAQIAAWAVDNLSEE